MKTDMWGELKRAAWAEIDLAAIEHNFRALRALAPKSGFLCCVKADSYGHGAVPAARTLLSAGAESLGVATIEEAARLREAGISGPIVLLGATPRANAADILALGLTPVVTTPEDARLLSEASQNAAQNAPLSAPVGIFLALETGMGRLGFLHEEAVLRDIQQVAALPGIHVWAFFSHFATAEEEDQSFALEQIERFDAFCAALRIRGVTAPVRTMANSAAILNFPQAQYELVRPGLALYGLYPAESLRAKIDLRPAMRVRASIVCLRKVPVGFSVSYGRRFTTGRESLIGTLPIGYADGLPRAASGSARALVRGRSVPIVGSVCMDQCMIDVTDVPGVREYDEATLIGEQDGETIALEEIAADSGTISYEAACRFGQRLPKVYLERAE
ncbi:MAG: alanine racemase [Clostridiales bacterium]|nr:alanine racemase [Clostridiales bacterium]